jgi:predicted ATPase/class 3 adenylate cyclase
MSFLDTIDRAKAFLEHNGRVSLSALKLEFDLDEARLESLIEELVDVQQVAAREGKVLSWIGAARAEASAPAPEARATPQALSEPATAPQAAEAERRQLTVMFCDLVDSTELSSRLDAEAYRDVVRSYQEAASGSVARYDGHIAQYLGDGVLTYFGYPRAHEDDAERAVRAALALVTRVQALNERLERRHGVCIQIRAGIHTGPVVMGTMGDEARRETLATGETTNVSARLQALAEPDTVVLSGATLRLVQGVFVTEDLGEHSLKGLPIPVHVFEALRASGMRSRLEVTAASELTPFVGRDQELMLLEDRWTQSRDGRGQAVLISGEAGIGKSRLMEAFRERIAEQPHTWLECRTSPYTRDSAFAPILDLHRQALGFRPQDPGDAKLSRLEAGLEVAGFDLDEAVPLLAALHSAPLMDRYTVPDLSPEGLRKKTLFLMCEWLLRLARQQPVILLVEDLHWIDPSSTELIAQFLEQLPTERVLFLLTFRPDFEAPWPARADVTPMLLSRLTRGQLAELVRKAARGSTLPDAWVQEILARSDGVPLFAEELTKAVLESNPDPDTAAMQVAAPQLRIPETLQDSLMARLDALGPVKELAQVASVLGREFEYGLLAQILPLRDTDLRESLANAVQEELFYQRGSPPEASFIFRHALIRDAAYESMLRSTRERHHRRVAKALIERMPHVAEGQPELVAHHWTEAGASELAIDWWERAGRAAQARVAHQEAIHHLRSALEEVARLPEGAARDARELDLLLPLGMSLVSAGSYAHEEAAGTFERARELCDEEADPRRTGIVNYYLATFHTTSGRFELGLKHFLECERIGREHEDELLLVAGLADSAQVFYHLPRLAEGLRRVERACEMYAPERCRFLEVGFGEDPGISGWGWLAWLRWYAGYPDASRAAAARALALAEGVGDPYTRAFAHVMVGSAAVFRRDWVEARRLGREGMRQASEQGYPFVEAYCALAEAIATGVGEADPEALDRYIQALVRCASTETQLSAPQALGNLARLQLAAGQATEAAQTAEGALGIADATEQHFEDSELHRLRGECFLRLPDRAAEAEAEFRHALEIARAQEAKSFELRAATSLARLWQRQGKRAEARHLLQPVYDWFTEGFDTQDLKDAKALLGELA